MTSSQRNLSGINCFKFENKNCNFLAKFILISFFSNLVLILFVFGAVKKYFLIISRKFVASLLKIFFLEKSKMAAKLEDML